MKSILVTGGAGFIGANFIKYVFEQTQFDGKIVNYDLLTYAGNHESLKNVVTTYSDRYSFIQADICNTEKFVEVLREHAVDTVVHFAAESHVDRSIIGPKSFLTTNVVGTYSILEAIRSVGSIHLHHVSTDEVFGSLPERTEEEIHSGRGAFFVEDTAYDPRSPYSASKASSDHFVRAYGETFGVSYTISNCSNNYGPYQFPEKLVPLMILNAHEGKDLPVYGDGKNVRDWLDVSDHCRAIWMILSSGKKQKTYVVGGRNELQNIEVVTKICQLVDELSAKKLSHPRADLIRYVKDRPGHDRRYAIDCSLIERELGWRPIESFESGIRKTVEWYLNETEWVNYVRSGEYRHWVSKNYKDGA